MTDQPPRYKVGQKVYLSSHMAPQLSGVHIVKAIQEYGNDAESVMHRTGQKFTGYSYQLQGVPGEWAETSLSGIS